MKIQFRNIRLNKANKDRLETINTIIVEYQVQGYKLTLRQLYYQLVSRDVIPNEQKEYAKLSILLKEGRMSGVVDWESIEDRLRVPQTPSSWVSPESIMDSVINSYQLPRLDGQRNYIECWVEKDALSGVLSRVTQRYHVPIMVNRGYSSVSAMFDAYKRFLLAFDDNQNVTILYLGDYDPSGIDMIRDVEDRIVEFFQGCKWTNMKFSDLTRSNRLDLAEKFENVDALRTKTGFDYNRAYIKSRFQIIPIALTRQQIDQYNPPHNPAKTTDPRSKKFIEVLGKTSWEVDALRPNVLNRILTDAIESRLDMDKYKKQLEREKEDIKKLEKLKEQL